MELQAIIGKRNRKMKHTRAFGIDAEKILSILMDFRIQGSTNPDDRYYYTNGKILSEVDRGVNAPRFYIHMCKVKNPQKIYQALLKEDYSLVDSKLIQENSITTNSQILHDYLNERGWIKESKTN